MNDDYKHEGSRVPKRNFLDGIGNVLVRLLAPDIVVIDRFLSDAECNTLIELSRPKLTDSTTVDPQGGAPKQNPNRTSQGCFFQQGESGLVDDVDRRLAALTGSHTANGEGLQVLRYGVGGRYDPHQDFFPPEEPGSAEHVKHGGQRVATVMLYLNDVTDGGETTFPNVGLEIVPRRGLCLCFGYCNSLGQVDRRTLHGGAPVREGEKWLAVKWFRQNRRS